MKTKFEWDENKESINIKKHKISFYKAQFAFLDNNRIITEDRSHSNEENRYYCIGKIDGEILTVRFTFRNKIIRIFGAGFWRKGKKLYEEKNKIH